MVRIWVADFFRKNQFGVFDSEKRQFEAKDIEQALERATEQVKEFNSSKLSPRLRATVRAANKDASPSELEDKLKVAETLKGNITFSKWQITRLALVAETDETVY